MRIPEETIEQIRENTNILDIISQYVQLKKKGQNHFAFCPFHEERTPSFSVREEKQLFHCFSCGRGGNIFSFIMEIEGMSFPEAVIKTAELADIPLDPELTSSMGHYQSNEHSPIGKLLSLHEQAKEFYHHILMHTEIGEPALQYLEKRGLEKETIETFKIGFAPDQRTLLRAFTSDKEEWTDEILEKSGLFFKRDDGEFHDRFFNRIMFPLLDHQGKTVAFSGRIFKENPDRPSAKYLNSPETDLFTKRKLLFHFESARPSIRKEKETYLFEGFMDVISAYQAGIPNAVATMGTSLTNEHIQQLEKITDHIVLAFDGDVAGMDATKRSAEFLTEETSFSLEVVPFPEKMDPDDYIQKNGEDVFAHFMENSRLTFIGFLMRYHRVDKNLSNDSQRMEYIDTILTEMTRVPSAVEREMYFQQLAEEFKLPIEALREQFQTAYLKYKKAQTFERKEKSKEIRYAPVTVQVRKQALPDTPVMKAEKQLLNRLFHFQEARLHVHSSYPDFHFYTDLFEQLYLLFEQFTDVHGDEMSAFIEYLKKTEIKEKAVEIELLSFGEDFVVAELDDCIHVIQQQQWIEESKKNHEALVEATKTNDLDTQQRVVSEIIRLNRLIKSSP